MAGDDGWTGEDAPPEDSWWVACKSGIDDTALADHQIPRIDLLVLNLYPFEAVTADDACTLADAIENIDIGGPAMLRSAAKITIASP